MMNKRRLHLLVSGPYGGLNLGDDAIAQVICTQLEDRGVRVTLAAENVNGARRLYPGVEVVPRLNLRRARLQSLRVLMNCDGVLVGGGEQLSEPRIPNPIWGHLATNVQLGFFSRLFKKKFGLLGVGIEQRISKLGLMTTAKALRGASFIGVRDSASKERLQAIIGNEQAVSLGADPAFLLKPNDVVRDRRCLLERFGIPANAKVVLFTLSVDKFHSLKYLDEINKTVKYLVKQNIWIIYALSDLQDSFDMRLYRDRLLYEGDNTVWFPPGEDGIEGLRKVIAATDCVVASRMHPLIFALVQSTPIVCLARSVKMHSLMVMVGETDYLSLENLSSSQLSEAIFRRLEAGSRLFEAEIAKNVRLLRKRASDQFEALIKQWGCHN